VFKGGSLNLWCRALPKGSKIVGIDINPDCARYEGKYGENYGYVRVGSQADGGFLEAVANEFGPFDFIVDDGSHIASHIITSFACLFPKHLAPGGIYVAEDMHTSYWENYVDQNYRAYDFFKDLCDLVNFHYLTNSAESKFREGHQARIEFAKIPKVATMVEEVSFLDSLIKVRKASVSRLPVSRMNP
jgi:hypothetical protein